MNLILLLFYGELSPTPALCSSLALGLMLGLRSGLRRLPRGSGFEGLSGRLAGKLEGTYLLNGVNSSHMGCDLLPCVVAELQLEIQMLLHFVREAPSGDRPSLVG